MTDTAIVPYVSTESGAAFIEQYAGEDSPLRSVMPHVAARAIGYGAAYAGTNADFAAIAFEAEKWLVGKYVREDFCGLCGRNTDHRGEH